MSTATSALVYPPARTPASATNRQNDVELMALPSVVGREAGERDPYSLRDKIISDADLDGIRQRKKGKKLASFYNDQNSRIEDLLKPLSTLSEEAAQDSKDNATKVKIAVNLSLIANCALAILQLYAAISSLSLALFASCIDAVCELKEIAPLFVKNGHLTESAVDPFANAILWAAHRASDRAEEKKWPVRGSRFETSESYWIIAADDRAYHVISEVGNIVYGSIMGGVNVILVVEAIQEFVTHKGDDLKEFHLASIIAVAVAFAVKFALFLYCYAIKRSSSQVQVLWEDHRNDLLTNGFGILTAAGGAKLAWWIDPMGATIIAMCIITVWTRTVYEQFTFLAGISAPTEFINLVTYKAMTFSPDIDSVDTVRVYHSGPNYFVEVDIVLSPEMPLGKSHDIAQDLQDQIEKLKEVDRCFVHVDHEVDHEPEHRKKI